jgi:hypothetical protein
MLDICKVEMTNTSPKKGSQLALLMAVLLSFILSGCGGGSSSGDSGGDANANCDVVANPAGPAFFKVENRLNSGLSWILPAFAFGADMKPGECTIMGVTSRQFSVELQQCNIGDAACTSTIGPVKIIVFSVLDGETFTLDVTSDTFI